MSTSHPFRYFAPKDHHDYPECPEVFRFCDLSSGDKLSAVVYMLEESMLPEEYDNADSCDVPLDLAEEIAGNLSLLFTDYGVGYDADDCICVSDKTPRRWRMIINKAGERETHDYPDRSALVAAMAKQIDYELSLDLPSAISIEAAEVDAASGVIIEYVDTYNAFLRYEMIRKTPNGYPYPAITFFTRATAFAAAERCMTDTPYNRGHYSAAEVVQINYWRNRERITCKRWHRESDD